MPLSFAGKPPPYRGNQASTTDDRSHGESMSQLKDEIEMLQKRVQSIATLEKRECTAFAH